MKGILILKFVEARNLEVKDVTGSSDPYFKLRLGDQHGVTRTYYKTINPIYDETFNFIVDDSQHILRIEGYDKDAVGSDDPLGICEIDMNSLVAFQRSVEWYPLKEVKNGEIRLLTLLIDLAAKDNRNRDPFGFVENRPKSVSEPLSPLQETREPFDYSSFPGDKLPKAGIPLAHKAETWLVRSGAKEKRRQNPETYKTLNCQMEKGNPEVVEQIDKDLERTFPEHPFFMPGAPGLEIMRRVLISFSLHTPSIGYCQGMGFVAGILLLFMEEEDAFWTLECIVNDILANYYDSYLGGLQVDSKLVDYYVMQYFPDLKIHLEKIQASPAINCMKWFLCIYVGIFPTQVTLRIWDSLFCSGRDVLIKVYLTCVRLKFGQSLKVQQPIDYYELLNETPAEFNTPTQLFAEVNKHFLHLYQVDKMRANAQKAISDAINKREELRLRSHTHFSIKELQELKQSFSKFAKNNTLSKEDFNKLLVSKVGQEGMYFMEDMFKVFDKSGDGTIDFREFCTGLSAFTKGSFDERLEFCYSLFDVNNDGFVQPDELQLILGAQYKLLFPDEDLSFVRNFVEFASLTFDTNKDGKFSLEEFKEVVRKQPLIVHFLNLTKFSDPSSVRTYTFKE
jgi:Ca2+-binding EF-hand superfamily protein